MKPRVGIIGFRNIGKRLYEKLKQKRWKIVFYTDSKNICGGESYSTIDKTVNYIKYCNSDTVDLIFLAIPTKDNGKIAFNYIRNIVNNGIPIVTCEKGALANFYDELQFILFKIGYSATVGGGTMMLDPLRRRINSETQEVHLIINGTLNYIWHGLSCFRPFGQLIEEAQNLGYAEPGTSDYLSIIKGEAEGDIPKKVAVLYNICFKPETILRAEKTKVNPLSEADLKLIINEAANRRFIVSIMKDNSNFKKTDIIGGFKHEVDGWTIISGFQEINSNTLFLRLITTGVDNAFLTVEGHLGSDGIYRLDGPGAGPGPTTSAMIKDAEKLLKL